MAIKQVYVGSVGPFLYDDTSTYDGTVEPMRAVYSDGKIRGERVISDNPPTAPTEVVRLADLASSVMNPTITDQTGSRSKGTVYQNTSSYWMIVLVSADLTA
jgi:hypothetical protein